MGHLAILYLKTGQGDLAKLYMKHAATLGNSNAKLGLGESLMKAGHLDLAAEYLEDAGTPLALFLRMKLQLERGSNPSSPEVRRWMEASARLGGREACDLYTSRPGAESSVVVICLTTDLFDGDSKSFRRLLKVYGKLLTSSETSHKHREALFSAYRALRFFSERATTAGNHEPAQLLLDASARKVE